MVTTTNETTFRPRCPTCEMMVEPQQNQKYLPFCSLRCRMVDLGRWLSEEHALPCKSAEDEPKTNEAGNVVHLPPGWHDA